MNDHLHTLFQGILDAHGRNIATLPSDQFARVMATDAFKEALDNGEDIKTATNYAEAVYHNIMNKETGNEQGQ